MMLAAVDQLHLLDARRSVAFEALCCERLLPAFERFADEEQRSGSPVLRDALDLAWQRVLGERAAGEAATARADAEQVIADLDADFASPFAPLAQNAAIAIVRMLEDLEQAKPLRAAKIAELAVDAVYVLVGDNLVPADADEEALWQHPLVREELECQKHDIASLRATGERDQATIEDLRWRAASVGQARVEAPARRDA